MDDLSGAFPLNLMDKRSSDALSVCVLQLDGYGMQCLPWFLLCSGYRLGPQREDREWIMGLVAKEEKQDFGARQTFTSKFQFLHFSSCVIFNKLFDFS